MLVDISSKDLIPRFAVASARLHGGSCRPAAAARAAAAAYRFLPFLHPVRLQSAARCVGGVLRVEAYAVEKTGVEMDALFGVLAGAAASGVERLEDLSVEVKLKGWAPSAQPGDEADGQLARRGDLSARAYGELRLRNPGAAAGEVEKGHPVHAAKAAAALASKRLCELAGGPCPALEHFRLEMEVSDAVRAWASVRSRDLSPAPEAVFSVGVALLTVWDMVKRFEKDEGGQYPHTRVSLIALA